MTAANLQDVDFEEINTFINEVIEGYTGDTTPAMNHQSGFNNNTIALEIQKALNEKLKPFKAYVNISERHDGYMFCIKHK